MLEGLEPPKNRAVYCKVAQVMQDLSESDQKILTDAIADKDRWAAKSLSNALRGKGLSIADTTIAKHRNKVCACYRD